MGGPTAKGLAEGWEAAVAGVAAATGVEPGSLCVESRGRGPRPPRDAWGPRKLAIYVTVVLTGCDYAELGRLVGLHRDTVASHCAWVREACMDDAFEGHVERVTLIARYRLEMPGAALSRRTMFRRQAEAKIAARVDELEAQIQALISSDSAIHPTKDPHHGNVITFPGTPVTA